MKKLNAVNAIIFAIINAGVAYTPFAVGAAILDNSKITVHANVLAESCYSIEGEISDHSVKLADINLSELQALTPNKYAPLYRSNPLTVEFKCSGGEYAFFKLYSTNGDATGKSCYSSGIGNLVCDGPNKSVGMFVRSAWVDKDGQTKMTALSASAGQSNAPVRSVKLTDGIGKINVIHDGNSITIGRVDNKEPEPGEISANYTLQIWSS